MAITKVKDLKPNPKNPRRIEQKKLEMLAKSMIEFGSLDGFIFNRTTEQLVGGHQRNKVVPENSSVVIEKKYDKPTAQGTMAIGYVEYLGERWPYREVEWSEAKEKAANIAANKGVGSWDYGLLSDWILDLEHLNFDLDLTLFDEDELKRLFGGWDSGTESVDRVEENLDGITAVIKIKCPQELYDEVTIFLKAKLLETSFTGVEIV